MVLAPLSPSLRATNNPPERKVSPTSPVSPSGKSKSKSKPEFTKSPPLARLPPPALFQGPPSRNASNISLHLPGANAAAIGLPASASISNISPTTTSPDNLSRISSRRPVADSRTNDFSPASAGPRVREAPSSTPIRPHQHTSKIDAAAATKRENDRADALWAEMQNTLAEVELSAAAGSHIFGAGHAKALEELRAAQLELAKAWARSEKDEVESHGAGDEEEEEEEEKKKEGGGVGSAGFGLGVLGGKDGVKQQQQQQQRPGKKTLEKETENDILLAKTRREANDRYFEQVNNSVLDAVKKLDEVAAAMRKVEKESSDIWSEDGDGTESVTGSTTGG
ncbi:hypothetical protein EPUS_00787 [Endocarpon pusillum Z07020]|uniref:Uncharacterized protein n=1 Tax=Endocarpon pusillum (strain Z07020 / HMAS-L-300199) TaxID=1263415 RepID=U1GAV7_ENDPU|nr:uncharacterized protein EPUS_00787 [Endocarpon pusillum Z07020]ERF74657.1 hypothetical protein EPUS_00787 [Endocarpon pusillum Z07020]